MSHLSRICEQKSTPAALLKEMIRVTEELFRVLQRLVARLLMVVEPLDVGEEGVEVLVGELAPRSSEKGFAVDLRRRRGRRPRSSGTSTATPDYFV